MSDEHTALTLVFAIVAGVGLFAWLPKPPWLERIWLWMIGLSFVLYVPIWLALKVEDHGWKAVAIFVVGLFVAGVIQGLPTQDDSSRS